MELTIKINLDNAAFDDSSKEEFGTGVIDCAEIRSILTKLCRVNFADRVRVENKERPILDTNGNRAGYWEIKE